jgi:hypothetical protein
MNLRPFVSIATRDLRLASIIALAFLCASASSYAQSQIYTTLTQVWERPVCFIETYSDSTRCGTGVLVNTPDPKMHVLFTALHVFEDRDSARITFGIYDSMDNRLAVAIDIGLRDENGKLYNVCDPIRDCAWLPVPQAALVSAGFPVGWKYYGLNLESFIAFDSLAPSMPVIFSGYPACLKLDGERPIVRSGTIAGIDRSKKEILIDGNVFGGASGGPVFLDKSQAGVLRMGGTFVGLVFLNLDVLRRMAPLGSQISENLGLGVVLPADVMKPAILLYNRTKPD